MSALGLAAIVALVAAALLAGVLRFRRRRPAPRPGPRTVAELVQLRAAAAKAEPGPAAEAPVEVPEEPESTPSETEPDRPAVPEPAPVVVAQPADLPAAERNGRVALPATSDTPWGRARRMTGAAAPVPRLTYAAADDSAARSSAASTGVSAPAVPGPTVDLDDRARVDPQPAAVADPRPAYTTDLDGAAPAQLQPVAADSQLAPTADLDGLAASEVKSAVGANSHPAPSVDLDEAALVEPQPAAPSDSRPASSADLDSAAPAEQPPAVAADSRPAPTADLDHAAPVEPQRAATGSRPTPTPDLDHPAPHAPSPTAATDSRPARTVDLDGLASAEPQSALAADPRPAPSVDVDAPAPAEPHPADTADPHPARADAPPRPGETEEQASRRVLRLVPPLPADSAIPVQRTQAPDSELALLGALGLVDPAADPVPALAGVVSRRSRPEKPGGPAQQIRFRVARRDGSVVPGAEVGLLDEDGQRVATGYADADGRGELQAPHPGTYLLVCVAPEHQPGVTTVSVADGPGEAALLVARSAVLTGSVRASYTPVVAARLTVVQDGEIVGGTHSDSVGAYRITDLGPGGYGVCVTAPGCVPAAVRIDVADGAELQRDIDLQRAGDVQREAVESAGELPEQATAADRQVVGHR